MNFLPSVTPHVTVGLRPQWVEDQSTCLCIYCHKSRGSSKIVLYIYIYIYIYTHQIFKCVIMPDPVAARSKAWVCGRSPAEIVGSNPSGGVVVCLL